MPITLVTVGASGTSGGGSIPWENPVTINMNNSNGTIDLGSYSTVSFRVKNPSQINLSNGIDGYWYGLIILSDGEYSFGNEVIFAYNNLPPTVSINNRVDVYSIHCVETNQGKKYLATYGFDYSTINI
jgi:hypothetical protein